MKVACKIGYLTLFLAFGGCTDPLDLLDRACPCADGWSCCSGICLPGSSCSDESAEADQSDDAGSADASALDAAVSPDSGVVADAAAPGDDRPLTEQSFGPCGPTCAGCCQINPDTNAQECVPLAAQDVDVCGESNNACTPCASNETCHDGVCKVPPCTEEGCPCDASVAECYSSELRVCVVGNSKQNCGNDGGTCTTCEVFESCVNGRCMLGSDCETACADKGCCDAQGRCIEYRGDPAVDGSSFDNLFGGQDDSRCGRDGQRCQPCPMSHLGNPMSCNSQGQCVEH